MTSLSVDFLKSYDPEQPRDDHGRWSTGSAVAADAGMHAAATFSAAVPGTEERQRRSVRDLGRLVIGHMHDAAVELASKAKHAVRNTRIVALNPSGGGGFVVRATHDLPAGAGHIESKVTLEPHHVRNDKLRAAVTLAHNGLLRLDRAIVPSSGSSITFKNGPAPTGLAEK